MIKPSPDVIHWIGKLDLTKDDSRVKQINISNIESEEDLSEQMRREKYIRKEINVQYYEPYKRKTIVDNYYPPSNKQESISIDPIEDSESVQS